MIVGAIVGVLASIAVNKYDSNKAKAHQAEAKLALSSTYSLEKAFYSEYGAYIPNLDAIGFSPEGTKRFYDIGYNGGPWTFNITGYTSGAGGSGPRSLRTGYPASWTLCTPSSYFLNRLSDNPWNMDDPQHFVMGAAGQIRDNKGCDVWQIDDFKHLQNTLIGY